MSSYTSEPGLSTPTTTTPPTEPVLVPVVSNNVVWPTTLTPRTFTLTLVADLRVTGSVFGGSEIVNDLEDDFWTVSMEVDSRSGDEAARLESLVNWLQGGINTAEFGHFARPQPRGAVLNTSLSASAAKGADSVFMTTSAGQEIKIGDMFSVSGLLLQVAETVSATGASTEVKLVNRLRRDLTSGSAVTFNNPKIRWRMSSASAVSNTIGGTNSVSLEFVEDIS